MDGHRALQLAMDACQADPACAEAFGDVRHKLDELLARLDRSPDEISIQHPRTGAHLDVTITRDTIVFLVRGALYSAELSSLLPLVIDRAHQGDYGPLAAMADPWNDIDKAMSLGMFFSVICSEDLSQITEADRQLMLAEPFLGGAALELYEEVCGFWPRGDLPAGYHDPVVSDRPVLVLSGALDPVTPPRWGELVTAHLTRARHVVVPGVAHGTLAYGCVPRLMAQFLEEGSVDSLDVTCVEKLSRPPFFSSFTGPAPTAEATVQPEEATPPLADAPADSADGARMLMDPSSPRADGGGQ
ncbi:alpha/beta hydrolase [Candidatus Latescibacterota bacterium]